MKARLRIRQTSVFAPTEVEIHTEGVIINVSHLVRSIRWERTAQDMPVAHVELSPTASDDVDVWARLDGLVIERPT